MIELKHIQELDSKIQSALALIRTLRAENGKLRGELDRYQTRITEMETLIQDFRKEQGAIEDGILRALKELDSLEDVITETESAETYETVETGPKSKPETLPEVSVSPTESGTETQPAKAATPADDAQSGLSEIVDESHESADESGGVDDEHDEEADAKPESDEDAGIEDDEDVDPPDTGESELDIF